MAGLPAPIDGFDDEHVAEVLPLHREPDTSLEANGTEMDSDIAADWNLWSEQIGRALLPILRSVVESTPTVTSAMIGTADGFNLCSLGLDEHDVTRVSAMTSSLLSLADAVTDVVDKADDHPLDLVSLAHGSYATVVLAVRHLIVGQLLIWLTGDASMKTLIESQALDVATSVRMLLGDD
jgi:predicted regulator of Ras-like GTPase activity (Roadblock/LC7/MglB family)